MRHLHTGSPFRLAIVALRDSDGYVDALLGLARDQIAARRPAIADRRAACLATTLRPTAFVIANRRAPIFAPLRQSKDRRETILDRDVE